MGGYGLQPTWGDGHNSGIFPFATLRKIAEAEQKT
ncbi:MAG: gamma-butyrobetaine hydroxylase-like domain-containing protein [Limisphaerales bacterium]